MALNIPINWTISVDDNPAVSSLLNSYGGGGGGGSVVQDSFTPTQPTVINTVVVALPPPLPTSSDPVPDITFVTVADPDSAVEYGVQSTPAVITLLESVPFAIELAAHLIRSEPVYYFSEFGMVIGGYDATTQSRLAELDVGDQLVVSKRFPGSVTPEVKQHVVEGVEHEITPAGHRIVVHTSPAVLFFCFELDVSELDDEGYGLAGVGPCP